jgi:hypothetical protein
MSGISESSVGSCHRDVGRVLSRLRGNSSVLFSFRLILCLSLIDALPSVDCQGAGAAVDLIEVRSYDPVESGHCVPVVRVYSHSKWQLNDPNLWVLHSTKNIPFQIPTLVEDLATGRAGGSVRRGVYHNGQTLATWCRSDVWPVLFCSLARQLAICEAVLTQGSCLAWTCPWNRDCLRWASKIDIKYNNACSTYWLCHQKLQTAQLALWASLPQSLQAWLMQGTCWISTASPASRPPPLEFNQVGKEKIKFYRVTAVRIHENTSDSYWYWHTLLI